VIPEISVTVYSGESLRHIFEVSFDYRRPGTEIAALQAELENAVSAAAEAITAEDPREIAMVAAHDLLGKCAFDPAAEKTTAYDVLLTGSGDSRAVAMAYAAICAEKGVPARIVSGLKNNAQHFWVLVLLGETGTMRMWRTRWSGQVSFNCTPTRRWLRTYRWDELDYPAAVGPSLLFGEREVPPAPEDAAPPAETDPPFEDDTEGADSEKSA
jgi:hypothetical protein